MKKVKKSDNDKVKNYGILFCLCFTDFLLLCFYVLLSIVTVTDISVINAIILLVLMFFSIYFIIKWQYENNKIYAIKDKKSKYKKQYSSSKNMDKKTINKIYRINKNQSKKNFHSKLKEQL